MGRGAGDKIRRNVPVTRTVALARPRHSGEGDGSQCVDWGTFIMHRRSLTLVLGMSTIAAGLLSPVLGPQQGPGQAFAESSAATEKEAFEAAKELGTVAAWKAFLASYSTGFHADLARAYLKKLGGETQAATPPPDDFPIAAGSWGGIVRNGPGQSYRKVDSLEEGQPVTLMARTDVMENGYPWFKIEYEDGGKGYQWGGILCSPGAERPDLYKTCPSENSESDTTPKHRTEAREEPEGCAKGHVRINGKCIERGAAAGYCGPGYRPEGGKCVKGYKAPSSNTPLSTAQKKSVKKGCPKGQVWSAAEGCHEDD
jgi:Bacterial SH3 domain